MTRRRGLLLGLLTAAAASACARVAPRAQPTAQPGPASAAALAAWRKEGSAMLSDSLNTLRTFEVFAAYRVSITPSSGLRTPSTLAWDPPTSAAWDEATHVSRSLHGRADQLFHSITSTLVDSAVWREQRDMADATRNLIDIGDTLRAYRDRVDRLPPGDASGALDLLDSAWTQWEAVAATWGADRAEPIGCS